MHKAIADLRVGKPPRRGGGGGMRWWAGLGAVVMALVGPVDAQVPAVGSPPVKVQLRTTNGQVFAGELVRDVPSHVLLEIGGLPARFERSEVAGVTPVPDVAAGLRQRRAALEPDDHAGRLAVAREMFAADLLQEARWEVVLLQTAMSEASPARASLDALLFSIEARRALVREAAEQSRPADAQPPGAARPPSPVRRPAYLSEAQINLVRVYEIDLSTAPVGAVRVPDSVLREAMKTHRRHPAVPQGELDQAALLTAPDRDQLAFLFDLEARSLYGAVLVFHDPEGLAAFRRQINPQHVARYFARHFGAGKVPGLDLVRYRPNTTPEAYTNFVRLCRFTHEGRPMIDRYNPEASLLLQWALPRDAALHPAPPVAGWRPRFRSLDDPRCVQLREWIDGLVKFTPDYSRLQIRAEPAGELERGAAR